MNTLIKANLTSTPAFGFASRMHQKRIYIDKNMVQLPKTLGELPISFFGGARPKNVEIKTAFSRARFS